ncbi:MAG: hypothetical protein H7Y38_10560, partial [Armatimonadetes bacterium]|nr:hypothetical protein [Armatimonadota bacterium]
MFIVSRSPRPFDADFARTIIARDSRQRRCHAGILKAGGSPMARRSFSSLRTKDAFDLVPIRDTTVWDLRTDPLTPSDVLLAVLQR